MHLVSKKRITSKISFSLFAALYFYAWLLPLQIDQTPDDLPVKIAAYTPKPSRKAAIRMAAPSATSTPMQNDMLADVESQIIQTKGVSAPSATRHPVSVDSF